jgi:ribosomal protein L44E
MPNYTPYQFTDMEQAFVDLMSTDTLKPTVAAREVGYSDYSHEATRLMGNPAITGAILKAKNRELITWREAIGEARRVTMNKMKDTRKIRLQSECTVCGEFTEHKAEVLIKDNTQLNAAKLILITMSKANAESLVDKADKEDTAETLKDAAERILGHSTEVPPAIN